MKRLGIVLCASIVVFGVLSSFSKPKTGMADGHEWVDLGLSVKWASCNVGAASPADFGNYYSWGETVTKDKYIWSNYKFRISGDKYSDLIFSKYNTNNTHGVVDGMESLEPADDAAKRNWGNSWRMPTSKEWSELVDKCIWTWTKYDGHFGYEVKSKRNGNKIFLPAAGSKMESKYSDPEVSGIYWSSTLDDNEHSTHAQTVSISSMGVGRNDNPRCIGLSIRPVTK